MFKKCADHEKKDMLNSIELIVLNSKEVAGFLSTKSGSYPQNIQRKA